MTFSTRSGAPTTSPSSHRRPPVSLATEYREKRDEIRAKRVALKSLYDEREKTTDDAKVAEKSDAIKAANLELADLVDKFEPIQEQYTSWQENETALKAMGDR